MKHILFALLFIAGVATSVHAEKPQRSTRSVPVVPSQATQQLFQAIYNGNTELADMLLSQGADINCRSCGTLTLFAIEPVSLMSAPGINTRLRWVLEHGANVNVQDRYGRTPLMVILGRGINIYWSSAPDTLLLLQSGADPTMTDIEGFQALHYLALKTPPSYEISSEIKEMNAVFVSLTKALIQRGANINAAAQNGTTPLMNVAKACNPDALDLFLSLGADPRASNMHQETALKIAIDTAVRGQNKNCNAVVNRLRAL